jgi:hypothetical protein
LIDEIIVQKIVDAAKVVLRDAPNYLLDEGSAMTGEVVWEDDEHPGKGSGYITLPDDFYRLVTFKMSDWRMPVVDAITEDSPLYAIQRSRFGVKGCPERPVVAIVHHGSSQVLEFYTCAGGEGVDIERAQYIPIPSIETDAQTSAKTIDIPHRLYAAFVYYTGYFCALDKQDGQGAQAMLGAAKQLMDLPTQPTYDIPTNQSN